jgi:antitoxin MazE
MKTKIAKWGNSIAVRVPKPYAEELGLKPGATVDMQKDGTRLAIETAPDRKFPVYRLEDLLAQIKPGQKPPPYEDWGILETEWPNEDWSDVAPSDAEWKGWKKQATLKPASKPGRKRAVSKRRRA